MRARQSETRRWAAVQRSAASGDAPQAMLAKIPAPAAAPQTPSAPQEPPGRRLPRAQASARAAGRSSSRPQFAQAVSSTQGTMPWCSGPCMCTPGSAQAFRKSFTGSRSRLSCKKASSAAPPPEWQSSQTKCPASQTASEGRTLWQTQHSRSCVRPE